MGRVLNSEDVNLHKKQGLLLFSSGQVPDQVCTDCIHFQGARLIPEIHEDLTLDLRPNGRKL